jgi:prolyl oligopeptidase
LTRLWRHGNRFYCPLKEFPEIAECFLSNTPDSLYMRLRVKIGDGGEIAHYIRNSEGTWTQVTRFKDQVQGAVLGTNQKLYLLSWRGSPRGKIMRIPLDDLNLNAPKGVVLEGPPGLSQSQDGRCSASYNNIR